MFRKLAAATGALPGGGLAVFELHPMQLARLLEETWSNRAGANLLPAPTGLEIPGALIPQERTSGVVPPPGVGIVWDHLMYAYMIENTRVYEIFRRVLEEYAYGERLGVPSDATQRWLRTTEQLFYAPPAPYQVFTLTSAIRPDSRALRRNAYFRMFGMDLNHGTDDNRPYPYPRPAAANLEFAPTLESLLRETWRGIENVRNQVGPSPTDDALLANLARRLFDMLTVRRLNGNLSREELLHVATMSWFHLSVSFDESPIVEDLEAQASSSEERLLKIGERVGLPAHSRSGAYFRLADNLSLILRAIELAQFNTDATAGALYTPSPPALNSVVYDAMLAIIRDWSIASGRDMKARPVSAQSPPPPQPMRPMPRPIIASTPDGNGQAMAGSGAPPQ
jgi:hypothetical protein